MRHSRPSPLTLKSPEENFKDRHPDREVIRPLSPNTERELRRSCSAVVLGHASPKSQRLSTIPPPLPTPAFPRHQTWQGHIPPPPPPPAASHPATSKLADFDFRLPTAESNGHSISSSISSTFSHASTDTGAQSWSPCTTHISNPSDGDQFVHAKTIDIPPVPQKQGVPNSPPVRYAFAKTATARKMSLNYSQINPRASSIISIAAQEAGDPAPPSARPTIVNVPRPRTSSGIPGSPRFRNSGVPSINPDGISLRKGSEGDIHNINSQPLGLGLAVDFTPSKLSRSDTPDTVGTNKEGSSETKQKVVRPKSSHLGCESGMDIRSTASTPAIGSSTSRGFTPKELTRRKTDMENSQPKKFSLFPCQVATPVIVKNTPPFGSPVIPNGMYSPISQSGVTSRSMSISSNSARPRTSGAEKPMASCEATWSDRQLPSLPAALASAAALPSPTPTTAAPEKKGKKWGKEKGEKTTFKSLRKQVLASFQHFSGSLKLKSGNKGSSADAEDHGPKKISLLNHRSSKHLLRQREEAPAAIGVAN